MNVKEYKQGNIRIKVTTPDYSSTLPPSQIEITSSGSNSVPEVELKIRKSVLVAVGALVERPESMSNDSISEYIEFIQDRLNLLWGE